MRELLGKLWSLIFQNVDLDGSVFSAQIIEVNLECAANNALANALSSIPQDVTAFDLSKHDLGSYSGAAVAIAFAAIPANINEITLSLGDIKDRTENELRALGKALPYVIKINLVDSHDNPVKHPKSKVINRAIGHAISDIYKVLHINDSGPQIPADIIFSGVLPYLIGNKKPSDLKSFVYSSLTLVQHAQKEPNNDPINEEKGAPYSSCSSSSSCAFFSPFSAHLSTMGRHDESIKDWSCNIQ